MMRDERLHAATRPPGRVRQKLHTVRRIESQRRLEQSEAAFGLEIVAGDSGVQELPRKPRDVVQARLNGRPCAANALGIIDRRFDRFAHKSPPSISDRLCCARYLITPRNEVRKGEKGVCVRIVRIELRNPKRQSLRPRESNLRMPDGSLTERTPRSRSFHEMGSASFP